jgi:CBS-domain-containing membrane protein
VVDQAGKLVGIITESDIFRMVVQEWSQIELQKAPLGILPIRA